MKLVETAIANARLTLSVLMFLMLAGTLAYVSIPKEAEPDIQIPVLYVSMGYRGISPEDSERLLLRPMETSLKSISGIKKLTSTAYQGGGNVIIEFQAGANLPKALEDVRSKVSEAKRDLPDGTPTRACGIVTVRQQPGTAKGVTFVTLEDETGTVNVIVWKALRERQRRELVRARLLAVQGTWQRDVESGGEVRHLIATRLRDLTPLLGELVTGSRDFR